MVDTPKELTSDGEYLPVGDGHELYLQRWGTVDAYPVIFVHGGPGSGCSPRDTSFFDPERHDVIFWDQRGAGKSRFKDRLAANTTMDLVEDLEKVRAHYKFEKVTLFAGSWGTTVSLLYAQTYPAFVSHLVLRGLFLADGPALDYFLQGAKASRPQIVERFRSLAAGASDAVSIARVYAKGMQSPNPEEARKYIQEWVRYEFSIGALEYDADQTDKLVCTEDFTAFALLGALYFANAFYIEDGRITRNIDAISSIPMTIVHGSRDLIASCAAAKAFARLCPRATFIETEAGHTAFEVETQAALRKVMSALTENERG